MLFHVLQYCEVFGSGCGFILLHSLTISFANQQSISTFLGEDNIKEIINFVLVYIAGLDIPIKR